LPAFSRSSVIPGNRCPTHHVHMPRGPRLGLPPRPMRRRGCPRERLRGRPRGRCFTSADAADTVEPASCYSNRRYI
jgi:hypothetical protein